MCAFYLDREARPSGERVATCGGAAPVPHLACPPPLEDGAVSGSLSSPAELVSQQHLDTRLSPKSRHLSVCSELTQASFLGGCVCV